MVIHKNDAIKLLETGEPCTLKVWKMSTGDILVYKNARCIGGSFRKGIHRIQLPNSKLIRSFRDIALFEINKMKIYL